MTPIADIPDAVPDRDVIVCDDVAAMSDAGLLEPRRQVLPLAFSPAIAASALDECDFADRGVTSDEISDLFQWTLDLAADLHASIVAGGGDDAVDRAALAARSVVQLQAALYVGYCLIRRGRSSRLRFAVVDYGDAALNQRFNGPASDLAARLPGVEVIRIAAPKSRRIIDPAPPSAGIVDRLLFNPWRSHAFRLEKALSDRLPGRGREGTIFIHRENELVKETAYHLARRGYAVRSMPVAPPVPAQSGAALIDDGVCAELIAEHARRHFGADAGPAVAAFVTDRLHAAAQQFRERRDAVAAALTSAGSLRPRCILTNAVGAPEAAALHAAGRATNVPLVMFQHGVTAEICDPMSRSWPSLEASASDLVCCFNRSLADLANQSRFSQGRSVAVGMPQELRRSVAKGKAADGPPIWYVSTGLYRGRNALLHLAEPDHQIAAFESRLIDQVLSRLPHGVVYKPYPSQRYADGDPVIAHARQRPQITVHEDRGDFRFIAARSRVIVTARATSTMSWCLMAGRPVVFIDIPTQSPLLPEARRMAESALFLFDAGSLDFEHALRSFLAKPIDEIDHLWQQREPARREFIDRFLDTDRGPAGSLAADAVEALVKNGSH